MKSFNQQQNGSILVAILIMMPFFLMIAAAYMELAVSSYRVARKDQYHTHAQLAVDAGIDASMEAISVDPDWLGTAGEIALHNDGNTRTTYESTVTSPDDDHKIIAAIGRTYVPASSTTASSSVRISVNLRPIRSGNFSIVTGVGGLYLSNSAKVLGGDVFVNGELSMTNSSQIGLSTAPVSLKVAHQNCPNPPDATYPRICNSGENGQPINITGTAWIYGNVSANNQTNGSSMSNGGLVSSSGVPTQPLPPHDRAAQKAAIAVTRTGSDASCTSNGGAKTWVANTKITGDVKIDKDCTVTIQGNVWITGKFEMSHSKAKLKVSDSLGTTMPSVMIDGQLSTLSNGSTIISNSSSTGAQLISYWSDTACSPDCADVTGVSLFNSRDDVTLRLSQSSGGANSIFYSRWSKVLVENSGQIGALVGQTVELQNSGTITFGTSVGTPTTYWVIDDYRRTFD